jgi:translation initiation factor 5
MHLINEIYLASKETSLNDSNYRYKIELLNIQCIGKTDNWTTYFLNSEMIAKKINRPSIYFGKYISHALSCQMKQDKDKKCLTFKGNYSNELITKYFLEFVKMYLLCQKCDYPETTLLIEKSKELQAHCESCGNDFTLKTRIDKVYDFIKNNVKK